MVMAVYQKVALDSPAAKVLGVLGSVARLQSASVTAIAADLGLTLPITHRICAEIARLGLLQRLPGTRQWTVARPMINLARTTLAAAAGSATADAIPRALTRDTCEMCNFGVQVGDEVAYVASAEPRMSSRYFSTGAPRAAFCTSNGRLFLSRVDDEE
jgi:DNA-binding IclR family transcriptional regulator